MNAIKVVFFKELLDNIRDRRTVLGTLFLGALMGPFLFALMFNIVFALEKEKAEAPLELPVVGSEHAPNLVAYLEQQGVVLLPAPESPEAAVINKNHDVVLRIPEQYPQQWSRGEPAIVELIVDKSRREASSQYQRMQILLQRYGQQIGSLRLQLRGVNPAIAQAVFSREVDVSTAQSRGALLIGTFPFFILMTVFMGGMYLAIDATSGEKERQSLEPLLINPVPRWQVMLGKVLAAAVFSLASLAVGLVAFHYAMKTVPVDNLGMELNFSWSVTLLCFLITLPLSIIASSLQCIIAAFAKGFREAQSYASMLVFVPMIPSIWLMLSPVKEQMWMAGVPLLSQVVLINSLIRGESISVNWITFSWLTTFCLGFVLCLAASRLYSRTSLIFQD